MVFAEKTGWIRFLRELHEEFDVSILALGGAPSALTSEYTSRDVRAAIKGEVALRLIGIVDYDPSGDIIANSFQNQLRATGIEQSDLKTMIEPRHYSEEDLEIFKFPLPKKEKTKLQQWLTKTDGIGGKPYGLESESMPREKLRALISDLIVSPNKRARRKK